MTILLSIFAALVALIVVYFFVLGHKSQSGRPIGLVNGQLARCPSKPNCVCSEYTDDTDRVISPIDVTGLEIDVVTGKIKDTIQSLGGKLQTEDKYYLAFTFNSSLFGFVDDVEIRLDADNNLLHLRSASRVGHSDLGVNKKRIEAIKAAF